MVNIFVPASHLISHKVKLVHCFGGRYTSNNGRP